jgi:hypothetical protein
MPSHQERVSQNYEDLCSRCLKRPNRTWDDERDKNWLCEHCFWKEHFSDPRNGKIPEHMKHYMED